MAYVVSWFEIASDDFDRAVSFYSTIFNREIPTGDFMETPHGFFCDTDGTRYGAIIKHPEALPGKQGTLIYLHADNLDQVLERVESAGGAIVTPKTSLGKLGTIAIVLDTEGNRVGLHTP